MRWKTVAIACGIALACVVLVAPASEALAWGASGHSIVAEVAQRRLRPDVLLKIRTLLGGEVSLASIASWADDVALIRPETLRLHFVNIPYDATAYYPARDCSPSPKGDCVINAIERFEGVLADERRPARERREALEFLVHFVADVHQPLHCIDRNGDAGASTTPVVFFGVPTTLHIVWDVAIVDRHAHDWGVFVTEIESWLADKDVAALAQGTLADWAWEAHRAAVDVAYVVPADGQLGEDYYRRALPVAERQLALAGVRLARILNDTLADR